MNLHPHHVALDSLQVSPLLLGFATFVVVTLSTSIVVAFALSFRAFLAF
jgi:hypothetical protein